MAHPRRPAEALEWERRERDLREADQTLADLDQTHADADQQGSEEDQQLSGLDQRLSDRDQHASDRDQMAVDWEREHASSSLAAEQAHRLSRVDRSIGTFAMPETTAHAAWQRVNTIQHALGERSAPASISTGHAQLRRGDTLETLVARADAALYDAKRSRGG